MNKDVEHEIILDVLFSNCTMKNIEDTRKANVYYKEKNQKAKELCNKK